MKKTVALLLALLMVFTLVACGEEGTKAPTEPETVSQAESTQASSEVPTDPEPTKDENEVWVPYDERGHMVLTDRDATGKSGSVSSTSWYASKAGLDVLKAGGNATDAAIAVAYALGVVEPYTSGIGGGGFMTIYDAGTKSVTTLDFRETAPKAATPEMWLKEDGTVDFFKKADGTNFSGSYSKMNRLGGLAAAVPGEVLGLEKAYELFASGKYTMAELIQPAIDLANTGYLVMPTMVESTNDEYLEISGMEELAGYYLDEFGLPYETGTTIKNEDLAKTLGILQKEGSKAFYEGEIADAIIATVQKYGGVMTKEDLAGYEVKNREPIVSTYRDYEIYTVAPSSSGGVHLAEILNILENFEMKSMTVNSPEYIHTLVEAFKIAFADRDAYMADLDYYDVPTATLTSKEYAKTRAAEITEKCVDYTAGEITEHGSTTSFSVLDKDGNMVTATVTIGDFYGSKMAVEGYGFILNDEMYDFDLDPQSVNSVQGGKRPLSSITPTVVLNPDKTPFLTIGTPGGSRIFSVIAQVVERMVDYGMDVQEAIETVRVFSTDSKALYYENDGVNRISEETLNALKEMGYTLSEKEAYDLYFGGVQGIEIKSDGTIHGGADPRRSGKALAY